MDLSRAGSYLAFFESFSQEEVNHINISCYYMRDNRHILESNLPLEPSPCTPISLLHFVAICLVKFHQVVWRGAPISAALCLHVHHEIPSDTNSLFAPSSALPENKRLQTWFTVWVPESEMKWETSVLPCYTADFRFKLQLQLSAVISYQECTFEIGIIYRCFKF